MEQQDKQMPPEWVDLETYRSAFYASPDYISISRFSDAAYSDSRYIDVNPGFERLTGLKREEVVGHTALEVGMWPFLEERAVFVKKLLQTGQLYNYHAHMRGPGGQARLVEASVNVVQANGQRILVSVARDITERLRTEQELKDYRDRLEQLVEQRTAELRQANRQLLETNRKLEQAQNQLVQTEKMAALGSLVAGVAHELNTPIGTSVTVASTLREQTQHMLQDVQSGNLRRSLFEQYLANAAKGTDMLLRALGRASELINSFKQVAVDQASNRIRHFDLRRHLTKEVLVTLEPQYKQSPYKLELALSSGIEMDSCPGPLGQVISHFFTNALTHAFEGRAHGVMRLGTRMADADHVEITFSDDGVGIPAENQKRVFDPFFTTRLGQGGSGLGMNIVYNLVTGVLGGQIQIDSTEGAGTTLTVVLPLRAPGAPGTRSFAAS